MGIRAAELKDMEAMLDIYNYEVDKGYATFDVTKKNIEERLEWFHAHNVDNHPLIVYEEAGKTVAYASLSPYRIKGAYAATVELSVYVHHNYRRRGIAFKLTEAILSIARERKDIHTVISVITGGNQASVRLHEKLGFRHCGTIREVGVKFGKLLDIENYQIMV